MRAQCARTNTRPHARHAQAAVNMVQFNKDVIVSASGDHTLKIWSMQTGECIRTLEGHERGLCLKREKLKDSLFLCGGGGESCLRKSRPVLVKEA